MRKLTILLLALGLAIAVAPAASAVDAGPFQGPMDGWETGYNPDPSAVAARCPTGYQWILQSEGVVELESDVYDGQLTLVNEHCSRWTHPPSSLDYSVLPGQIAAGEMVLTTPGGDTLEFATGGMFVFKGSLATMEYTTEVRLAYDIVGGSGLFEGASGHGVMLVSGETVTFAGRFVGSLAIDN